MTNKEPEQSKSSQTRQHAAPGSQDRISGIGINAPKQQLLPDTDISHAVQVHAGVMPEEEEPEQPRVMGCQEDKKLNQDIYQDMLETTAEKNHLNLKNPAEKHQAHMLILPLYRERFRANKRYEKQDKEGPPTSFGPEFIIKDGGIYYPEFNKSLQEMYADQQRIRPWLYDKREHETMTLVEQAFANGATVVSHVSHNKDADGREAIRDQIILRLVDNHGTMEIKNIALDGNAHSTEEALDVMRQSMPELEEVHPEENIGIFTDTSVSEEQIQEVLSSHDTSESSQETEISYSPGISEWVVTDTVDTMQSVSRRVFYDVGDTYRMAQERMRKDDHWKVIIPPFLKRLLGMTSQKEDDNTPDASTVSLPVLFRDHPDAMVLLGKVPEGAESDLSDADLTVIWKKRAETLLNISPHQAEVLLHDVQETHEVMQDAQEIISFAVDTGVATGAALFALDVLTLDVPVHDQPVDRDFIHPEAAFNKLSPFVLFESADKITDGDREYIREQFRLQDIDADSLFTGIDFLHSIETLPSEKQEQAIVTEQEKTLQSMGELMEIAKGIIRQSTNKTIKEASDEKIIEKMPNEQKPVEQFAAAVTILILLKLANYHAILESFHTLITKPHGRRQLFEFIREEKPEGLIQKEPAPWLLFAIIWYLAMIREQGLVQGVASKQSGKTVSKKKQKKGKVTKHPFERHAVIFALCS